MGVETYSKSGQVSKKAHGPSKRGTERYKRSMYEPCDSVNGAPEAFERKYGNNYRKTSLPGQEAESEY